MSPVPKIRISVCNDASPDASGKFVLYWMIAARRLSWNFGLDRAIEWARQLRKPLLIMEGLLCDYPWASERLHYFVIEGMAEKCCPQHRVSYYPFVEPSPGAGKGLLTALAAHACVVVTDEFPCFFLPGMIQNAARKLLVRFEAVDSNGLLPLRAASEAFSTAFSFRRFLQKTLPVHLSESPCEHPLRRLELPPLDSLLAEIAQKWPRTHCENLKRPLFVTKLPIDHRVTAAVFVGGERAARDALSKFLDDHLESYSAERNEPDRSATSGLSPYLHFGHISVHEMFSTIVKRQGWSPEKISLVPHGRRLDWWGLSPAVEEFFDQLITWRELGFNFSSHRSDCDRFESLPDWAKRTLTRHARDERAHVYTLADFASANTHDDLWNAAQRQLVREGRLHNYLRMLWGKKILEWSPSPQEAVEIMIDLNNRYALDGRDPNSYSGIFWCLGRYDHPWGPERPILGTVRYMSSQNTTRKVSVKEYLRKYAS